MLPDRLTQGYRAFLALHGAYFGIAAGRLLVRDPATGRFEPVADGAADRPAMNRW